MHMVLLGLLLAAPWWRRAIPAAAQSPMHALETTMAAALVLDEPNWVDLAQVPEVLPATLPAIPAALLPSEDHAAMDRGQGLGLSLAPRIAIAAETSAPATDSGEQSGRLLDPAFRRDSSTLHARLTDGSSQYRPEHERTGRLASSPDATRKESKVGMGDSSRTRHHAVPEARVASSAETTANGENDSRSSELVQAPHRIDGRDAVRGEGRLDAEVGEQSFDTPELGPARDSRWVRAASDEKRPSLMDLSTVSAPGPMEGQAGRGPGEQPGVVERPSPGNAPALPGNDALALGEDSRSAAELVRSRYEMEIRRRIARALRFPHRLALMLEQGESIVAFTVGPDGRVLGSIRLLKSAGFEAFDAEAMAAVARAAPFPATGRTQAFSMRVPFENPVVR
jgi:TonB family protein